MPSLSHRSVAFAPLLRSSDGISTKETAGMALRRAGSRPRIVLHTNTHLRPIIAASMTDVMIGCVTAAKLEMLNACRDMAG